MADNERKKYAETQAEADANQSVYGKLYNRSKELEKQLYYNDDKNAVIPDAKAKRAELDKIEAQMKGVGPTTYVKRPNPPLSSEMVGVGKVFAKGGKVSSASKRADGCAVRGKTRA